MPSGAGARRGEPGNLDAGARLAAERGAWARSVSAEVGYWQKTCYTCRPAMVPREGRSAGVLRDRSEAATSMSMSGKLKRGAGPPELDAEPQRSGRQVPAETGAGSPVATSSDAEVSEFVRRLQGLRGNSLANGRLIFAMDATMSRQPTWDMA